MKKKRQKTQHKKETLNSEELERRLQMIEDTIAEKLEDIQAMIAAQIMHRHGDEKVVEKAEFVIKEIIESYTDGWQK